METQLTPVIAGFIPLLDCAVLVAAKEIGFAEKEGISLKLVRETSWANVRDRIAIGHFDVAHMLAPMPIAASLNLTSLSVPMLAPMVLGLGGNAITVSNALWEKMKNTGAGEGGDPQSTGTALKTVVQQMKEEKAHRLRFGVVHPFSGHAYELRYWLAAAGIDPDQDVEISVLPPQLMADALKADQVDGYCVGEPWNTAAVVMGTGRIVTYKQAIWPNSPEKVLGVTQKWAEQNPETFAAIMRAISAAAEWCSDSDNKRKLAQILSNEDYLDCPIDICLPALLGALDFGDGTVRQISEFLVFSSGERAAPLPQQGVWFFEQMVRWGQAEFSEHNAKCVAEIFSSSSFLKAMRINRIVSPEATSLFDQP